MLRKRGEEEEGSWGVIIALIIMLIVLVGIVFLIFRVDIIQMIKDLPGYHYNETDTTIDWDKLSDAEKLDICPTGKIVAEIDWTGGNYLKFKLNGNWVKSILYYAGNDEANGKIVVYRGFWTEKVLFDKNVAIVEKRVINLTAEFKNKDSEIFNQIKPVTFEDISKLDGAHMASSNYICEGNVAITPNDMIDVPIGRARYSDGNVLESMDFISCSAVILDCGNKAVMAHAPNQEYLPYMYEYQPAPEGDSVYIENVVEELSKLLQEKGINPQECKAFINAGSSEGLENITNDLKEDDISIESSNLDTNPRNIQYDPKTDNLSVIHTAGIPGM